MGLSKEKHLTQVTNPGSGRAKAQTQVPLTNLSTKPRSQSRRNAAFPAKHRVRVTSLRGGVSPLQPTRWKVLGRAGEQNELHLDNPWVHKTPQTKHQIAHHPKEWSFDMTRLLGRREKKKKKMFWTFLPSPRKKSASPELSSHHTTQDVACLGVNNSKICPSSWILHP